ncbi:hypothetical protein BU26DRAFT_500992 [Trematosphaeria pertusa]|uniref:Uncharacterized protein n=1 Tax=Trematosphaeria pertusa TaxID=390896 RepID=A0A6A6J1T2_9PLEO|nr:uncharacterized protein BU26DRAFT_500992 [Trematosphaeria pertusa]KAF2255423.1 hypothetical protein BU26DRAFT_500992 [Trematosphaeria pertusa]
MTFANPTSWVASSSFRLRAEDARMSDPSPDMVERRRGPRAIPADRMLIVVLVWGAPVKVLRTAQFGHRQRFSIGKILGQDKHVYAYLWTANTPPKESHAPARQRRQVELSYFFLAQCDNRSSARGLLSDGHPMECVHGPTWDAYCGTPSLFMVNNWGADTTAAWEGGKARNRRIKDHS